MNKIYMDYAATTYVRQEVLNEMLPYFTEHFGNANSIHESGRDSAKAVSAAREKIAKILNVLPGEIYFTSGGTEADNWAVSGIAYAYKEKGNHIITSQIEHAALLATCAQLEKRGFEVSYAPVDNTGTVIIAELEKLIRPETTIVSIMTANNEIGTIQPIAEIAALCKKKGVYFHTDAVQAAGALDLDVKKLGVDLMSISGHKIYGPKGIGVLYVRNGIKIDRLMNGGHQERTRRGGTTNVPAVVGMAKALELSYQEREQENARLIALRNHLIEGVLKSIPTSRLNGHPTNRLPNNANFSFEFIEGEGILLSLDMAGIAVSSGSACSSGSLEPSHVLLASCVPIEVAHGSIRFSLGKSNTMEEVDYVIAKLKEIIDRLLKMSPLFMFTDKGELHNV